jgi:hypothetical protein
VSHDGLLDACGKPNVDGADAELSVATYTRNWLLATRCSQPGYAEVAELGEASREIVPDRLREYRGQDHLALR